MTARRVWADDLCTGRLLKAHKECALWSRLAGIPYLQLMFGKSLPLALESLGLRHADYMATDVPSWLADKHRNKVTWIVGQAIGRHLGGGLPTARAQRRMAEDLFATSAAGYFNEFKDLCVSHPYTHRPLVEFCVSVPIEQFTRNGETRLLMRRALRDVLPEPLLKRRGKQTLDEAVMRALHAYWEDVGDINKWRVCERGYATPFALQTALEKMRLGAEASGGPLLRVLTLERWLRSLETVHSANSVAYVSENRKPRRRDLVPGIV